MDVWICKRCHAVSVPPLRNREAWEQRIADHEARHETEEAENLAPPRWKAACINWTHTDAPHAVTYVLIDGSAWLNRYHDTWADAVAWLDANVDRHAEAVARHAENLRKERISV